MRESLVMDRESRRAIRERGEGVMDTHSVLERDGGCNGVEEEREGWG